jgi:hypothetical protein
MKKEDLIYVHQLSKFEPKAADIESVRLIRDIKRRFSYPLTIDMLKPHLAEYSISTADINAMILAMNKIPPTVLELQAMIRLPDDLHEPVNIRRSIGILQEVYLSLQANILFAQQIMAFQDSLPDQTLGLFNSIPTLKSEEEIKEYNRQLSIVFERILRNPEFCFRFDDIVFEAQKEHVTALIGMINNGYFFRIMIEEELKKLSFDQIKSRFPQSMIQQSDRVLGYIQEIKKGVDSAYDINMGMVTLALVLYSYVKWLTPE